MSKVQQPEALRLADECDASAEQWLNETNTRRAAASTIRRLHEEKEALKREIESHNKALPQTVQGSKIDLRKMREAALHAQVHGYLFKASGSEVRQVIDMLFDKSRELDSVKHELVAESARTAAEKRRADQMSLQHSLQAALNREAREQLARYAAAEIATQGMEAHEFVLGVAGLLPDTRDGEFFRWLTGDHESAETRIACASLIGRMSVMSTSAVRADIANAIAAQAKQD